MIKRPDTETLLADLSIGLDHGPVVCYELNHSGRRMTRRRFDKMMTTVTRSKRVVAICRRGEILAYMLPRRSPWAKVLGPVYSTAQVKSLLGGSRQAVNDRVRRRTLLALRTTDDHLVYPSFQFEGTKVLPGLAEVLQAVGDVVDNWTLASWLVAPQPNQEQSVIESLARN
jgi:hypothetical protein